ncbi:MAG: DUF1631 family protein [Pseudomonadales bacterium]|nr:DUF1631 family protein [Pseudomonadales bacterium]
MYKRRSPRYALHLNALVHPNEGRSWLCSIQDFCDGGMLLVEQDASRTRRSMPGINAGESVGIHFSVPSKQKDLNFRLNGVIVRVLDAGVGIQFASGMADDAMAALLNYSNSAPLQQAQATKQAERAAVTKTKKPVQPATGRNQSRTQQPASSRQSQSKTTARDSGSQAARTSPAAADRRRNQADSNAAAEPVGASKPRRRAGPIKPSESKNLVASVRAVVAKVLPEMNSAFFSYMDEELLKLARDSKSNAEQSEYFAAMSNLEKAKKRVGQGFTNEVLDQIDNPRDLKKLLEDRRSAEAERKQKQASRIKLSLVNTEEFEDWLAIANIISRSERAYERYLQEIRARLGMLVDSWGHVEANPLGTSVFCHAFDASIRNVDLSKEIRQKVYSGFEAKAIPLFRKLYISVTKLLEDSQLFPDYDEDFITPSAVTVRPSSQSAEKDNAVDEKAGSEESAQETDDADEEVDFRAELRELREELLGPSGSRRGGSSGFANRTAGRSNGGGGRNAPANVGQAISSIYCTVRDLMSGNSAASESPDFPSEDHVNFDEVQDLLGAIKQRRVESAAERPNIRQMLMGSARASNRAIAPDVMESLEVVENLVTTVETDNLVSSSAKDWIRQLELTLDKVATQETDFLNDETPHSSLEVINQLARLGGSESGSVKRTVDKIVEDINQNFDSNPQIFEDALGQLQPIVEKQSRAFTGNVQRTVKASEGLQTLVNAQRAVVDEMDTRLAGRQIPEVLLRLLMPGWRNLMVNTHLRQGQDSADWRKHVQALDQVFQHLEGSANPASADYLEPAVLLKQIESGLDSISFEPGQRAPLVNSLREMMSDDMRPEQLDVVDLSESSVAETLGFGDVKARDELRETLHNEQKNNPEWKKWLDRAKNLHVGDWLEFNGDAGDNQVSIVAWSNEDNSNFVFVNRRGIKTHDLVIEELTLKLINNEAKVLEESDLPLSDRASHQMLQNMHNQLTHQATHDELTSLVNRKEFERVLEELLVVTKKDNSHHIVAYMDLDQFKVINTAAGHDAGDQLLINIGKLLVKQLAGSDFLVSRLGGDEFGVLIKNCEKESGISVIKQLSDAIKANRFKWEKEEFSLTTSCGVVYVTTEMENVSSILRGADTACYAAKDAGRDRIHVYEVDDSEMEHRRDIMEFVSQIDHALKEDRFVLNCQKIAPIEDNGLDHDHYEILLTVLDENDNPLPPQDFIIAAETYNRMGAIDRWVIKNAFRWIAANILKLDGLGAFSINISGNSLTEDDFLEFVLEQFNETRLPTSKICFEITETSAIGSLDDAIEFMEKLKIIGVQFSLDDFGTGLSSYSYLRNLPVDYLKIDGIFVKDIKTNPSDYAVVKSINEIGHFMGKKTIAEFVEDDEVLEILREIGVDFAQGYGIGKKIPITELLKD